MIWLNYSDTHLNNEIVQQKWDYNTQWTDYLLYRKDTIGEYLLINKFKEHGFPNSVFEYRKNDLIVFSNNSYKNISSYDDSSRFDTNIPIGIDAIIEHENDYKNCFEEIRKLTETKAKLKVLITYPPNDNSKISIIKKMKEGISQSNSYLEENNQTEYLLVLGKITPNIKWEFIVFDTRGNIK